MRFASLTHVLESSLVMARGLPLVFLMLYSTRRQSSRANQSYGEMQLPLHALGSWRQSSHQY